MGRVSLKLAGRSLLAVALVGGWACEGSRPDGSGTTRMGLTVDILAGTDVARMRFEATRVSCAGEAIAAQTVTDEADLADMLAAPPPAADASAHLIAQRNLALSAGCWDVTATPLTLAGGPSAQCSTATQHGVVLLDGSTTDVSLVSQCTGPAPSVLAPIAALNHPPMIEDLQFEKTSIVDHCDEQIVCVVARDPDKDPIDLDWAPAPGNALAFEGPKVVSHTVLTGGAVRECASFLASTAGLYRLQVTAYDQFKGAGGALIRAEDWFTAIGDPHASHTSLAFQFSATGIGPCSDASTNCADLVEQNILHRWTWGWSEVLPTTTTLEVLAAPSVVAGQRGLRAVTTAGFDFFLRYTSPTYMDVSLPDELRLSVRALNTTPIGWQMLAPAIVLEDVHGKRRRYDPTSQLLLKDGVTWVSIAVPLHGGAGWNMSGPAPDLTAIKAIEVHTDTWDYGFTLDIDAVSFEKWGATCPCPAECGNHGTCQAAGGTCLCEQGYAGTLCDTCATGFTLKSGKCQLANDCYSAVWPNQCSKANSDPWLAVHHDEIQQMRPNVIALNFANPSTPASVSNLTNRIATAMATGSKFQGFANPAAAPQIQYQIKVVDLRDGVDGRPAAPAGYPYQNSTALPFTGTRPLTGPGVSGQFDYAALFTSSFAHWYGYPDPANPGQYLDLCTLVNQGKVHEIWLVASQDVADVGMWEVVEMKPAYTATGNRAGWVEYCAGNGCFPSTAPFCGRSLRVGFVNYTRGPGCFVESLSHGLESAMNHGMVPSLNEWFRQFAGFNLNDRYGVPFGSLYACGAGTCVTFPTQTTASINVGTTYGIDPYDSICGNVHFPPNGGAHYDINNPATVTSSCTGFGKHAAAGALDQKSLVHSSMWMTPYGSLADDCDGPFLVWWYQNMPGYDTAQTFIDGRPMKSVWPSLYY